MSTPPRHAFPAAILAGAILLPWSARLAAAAAGSASPSSETILEGEVKQQQLQAEAQALAGQLDFVLGEYSRNGLGGEDVETVKALRDSISRLSEKEMKKVVTLLEQARAVTDPGKAKQGVSSAYAAEKGIVVEMKRLLAEHQRNQQALEVSVQLSQLADRQSANLQNGIELGKWSGAHQPEALADGLRAHLEGQKTEEAAIGEELKIVAGKIAEFAKTAGSPELAARFQKGVDAAQKLQPSTDAASEALKAGQLFRAVASEKAARDQLRQLARDVAPPQNPVEALRQAERELERLERDQKEIATNAGRAKLPPDFNQWLQAKAAENSGKSGDKKFQRPVDQMRADKHLQDEFTNLQREKAAELAGLEDPQGDLALKAGLAQQDLEKSAPAAAEAMKAAGARMQEARAAIASASAAAAAQNATEAAAALEAARAQVAQLAGAGEARSPDQEVKALQNVAQAAHELAQREAAAAANPDKAPQAALAKQIAQLAQQAQAAGPAPAANQALQQAAAEAQKAADAAAAGQLPQAVAAEQAAARALAQAAEQATKQMAAEQQAQQQLAAAEKAVDSLATIIKTEQALERDTAKALAEYQPKKEWLFKGQNDRQEDLQARTGAFKTALSPDLLAAISSLTDATIDMGAAKDQLDKPAGHPADEAENKALVDLYHAQSILERKVEAAQAELGEPQPPEPAATAEQQLAKAEAAAAHAMQQLQQAAAEAAPKQAAADLQQAAQQLAQAAAEAGEVAAAGVPAQAGAQEAAQEAARELSQAAAQAAAQNGPAAQAAAEQGAQALARAEGALAQAHAGLAQAGPPESGPPGNHEGPPHPGSHPGNHPGKEPGAPGTKSAQSYQPAGEQALQKGARSVGAKPPNFTGLPPRERAAIEQAQSEKYPEEFGTQIEQYMRNLAAESSSKPAQ